MSAVWNIVSNFIERIYGYNPIPWLRLWSCFPYFSSHFMDCEKWIALVCLRLNLKRCHELSRNRMTLREVLRALILYCQPSPKTNQWRTPIYPL
jgi:hypothetical protein